MGSKYDPINFFLETYNYHVWFKNEKSTDIRTKRTLPPMSALEDDKEEVKEGKRLKILTPNKLLIRLLVLLVQLKAGHNSCKLKKQIGRILYLFYLHNKITKKLYKNLIKGL